MANTPPNDKTTTPRYRLNYSTDERKAIVGAIAARVCAGELVIDICPDLGITRMALWYWCNHDASLKSTIAGAFEQARLNARQKQLDKINERRGPSWRQKSAPVLFKSIEGRTAVCGRCGHTWKPQVNLVSICPHVTCRTRFWSEPGHFTASQKKDAETKRLAMNATKRRRGKPCASKSAAT